MYMNELTIKTEVEKMDIEKIVNGPRVIQVFNKDLAEKIKKELSSHYDYVLEVTASNNLDEDIEKTAKIHTYHGSGMGKFKTVAIVVSDSSQLPIDIIKKLQLEWSEGLTDFGSTAWNVDKLLLLDERPRFLLFAETLDPDELGIFKNGKVQSAVTPYNRFILYYNKAHKLIESINSRICFSGSCACNYENIYQEMLKCWLEMKNVTTKDEHSFTQKKYKELEKLILLKIDRYGFSIDEYIKIRAEEIKKEYERFGNNFSGFSAWIFIQNADDFAKRIRAMFFFNALLQKNAYIVNNKEASDIILEACRSLKELTSEINSMPKYEFEMAENIAISII